MCVCDFHDNQVARQVELKEFTSLTQDKSEVSVGGGVESGWGIHVTPWLIHVNV